MKNLVSIMTLGILVVAGCGGSSSGTDGSTSGAGGSTSGPDGSTSGAGGSTSGAGGSTSSTGIPAGCNAPACLTNLVGNCAPSGDCVEQASTTGTGPTNTCYANGVSEISSADLTTLTSSIVFKKAGAVCYTVGVDLMAGTGSIKDASGKTVATIVVDASGYSVTCTGGAPVTLNAACDSTGLGQSGSSSTCTTGPCNP